jgi:uncharacterized protein YegL
MSDSTQMNTNNGFYETTVQFHKGDLPLSIEEIGIPEGARYGIIHQRVFEHEMDNSPKVISFTIDISDSMNEGGIYSKLHYVKHTVTNILRVIESKNINITIQVNTFNNEYKSVIDLVAVTKENVNELIEKIENISANGSTNIGLAIMETHKKLDECKSAFSNIYHFLLTDGNPTVGETKEDILTNMVSTDYPSIFIGYGMDHNAKLLIDFSKTHYDSCYQLVDNIETIGNLCGELLHSICYPVVNNVQICTPFENDFIYDVMKNEWTQLIHTRNFVSGKEYDYSLYSMSRINIIIFNTKGVRITTNEEIDTDVFEYQEADLTKYIFRHAVNRALYDSMQKTPNIKIRIRELFQKIRKYAKENSIENDTYYKLLFDDLYTAYNSYNDYAYIHARVISNSRHQTFRASSGSTPIVRQSAFNRKKDNGLQRMVSNPHYDLVEILYDTDEEQNQDDIMNEDTVLDMDEEMCDPTIEYDNIDHYTPTDTQNDYNSTQTMTQIMSAISS